MSFQADAPIVQDMKRQQKHLSVLIVGAHPNVCCGLEAILTTFPIVGEVQSASYITARNILEGEAMPDVVLVDAVAEGSAHVSTILTLRDIAPQSQIIVLTLARNVLFEEQGFRVLLKSADTDELMWALQNVVTKSAFT